MSHRLAPTMVTLALLGFLTMAASATSASAIEPSPALPPVGTSLVGGDSTQGIVEVNSSTAVTFNVPITQKEEVGLAWNSDGNRLAVYTPGITNLIGTGPSTLVLSNVDGGCQSVVATPTGLSSASAPAWSPDGLHLAVDFGPDAVETGPDRIGIVDQDGTDPQLIGPAGAKLAGPQPWSPDGSRLLIVTGAGLQVVAVGSGQTTTLYAAQGLIAAPASWSPDGSSVVFSPTTTGEDAPSGLFIVRSDGTGLRALTSGPDWFPSFSPLGKLVAFLRSPGEEGPGDIWVVSSDGSGAHALTAGQVADSAPLWSPDGTQIASSTQGSAYVITIGSPNRYFLGTFLPAAFFTEKAAVRGGGYRVATAGGTVAGFGTRCALGSASGLGAPIVGMASTPSGHGYWLVASDGEVATFGDAAPYGSASGLRAPIVGMASTSSGHGYWLVAADGEVATFGDAAPYGSASGLNKPIVGMASTPSGRGYWLVASDGGIFNFGDAAFLGSTGAIQLNKPIVGMASTPSGRGYWLVASDGGIFTFGDARYTGSLPETRIAGPAVAMAN